MKNDFEKMIAALVGNNKEVAAQLAKALILRALNEDFETWHGKRCSRWHAAVFEDAGKLLDDLDADNVLALLCAQIGVRIGDDKSTRNSFRELAKNVLLNGARTWYEWSRGGCGLVYNCDIAEHYCTPSQLKRTNGGLRRPNSLEDWLDVQARAMCIAACDVRSAAWDVACKVVEQIGRADAVNVVSAFAA